MIGFIFVGLGGAIGSILRYLISLKISSVDFPYATLSVNAIGSLLMGVAVAFFLKNPDIDNNIKILITTGFLGGFTTFSTFSLDSVNLIQRGEYYLATLYILLNVVLSLLCLFLGFYLVNKSI